MRPNSPIPSKFCIIAYLRKLAAISLILLFLFNTAGYWFLLNYLEARSNAAMVTKLDHEDYNISDLVTITVPTSLAYEMDMPDFERMDGQITIRGRNYRCVKRKIFDGQITFLCLPDENAQSFKTARDEFIKIVSDASDPKPNSKSDTHTTARISPGIYDIPLCWSLARRYGNPLTAARTHNIDARSVFFPGTDPQPPRAPMMA